MTDARQPTDTEAGSEGAGLRVPFSGEGMVEGARRRLFGLLAAKAGADLLLVCALAAGFYYASFRHTLRGELEHADAAGVRGWVVDESRPGRLLEVQLYLDGRLAGSAVADRPREGSEDDGARGFVFRLDPQPPGQHEARVYALHAPAAGRRHTLRQIGEAARFVTEREGGGR